MDGNWDNTDGAFGQIYGLLEQTFANSDTTVFPNNTVVSDWLANVSVKIAEVEGQIQVFEEIIKLPNRSEDDNTFAKTFLANLQERHSALVKTAYELPYVRAFRIYYKTSEFFGPNTVRTSFVEKLLEGIKSSNLISDLFFDVKVDKPFLFGSTNLYEITLIVTPFQDLKLPDYDEF